MAEEIIKEELENPEQDYIDTIAQLKQTTVSKDDYNKLAVENKKLLEKLVQGGQIEVEKEKTPADIDKLRTELYNSGKQLSNLDYITKTLELRDALIESGEGDPFLPTGTQVVPTQADIEASNRVAEVFKHCVEYADGDSEVFTNELQRLTNDSMPAMRRR